MSIQLSTAKALRREAELTSNEQKDPVLVPIKPTKGQISIYFSETDNERLKFGTTIPPSITTDYEKGTVKLKKNLR